MRDVTQEEKKTQIDRIRKAVARGYILAGKKSCITGNHGY